MDEGGATKIPALAEELLGVGAGASLSFDWVFFGRLSVPH